MEDRVDLGVATGRDAVPFVRQRVAFVGSTITTIRCAVSLVRQAVTLVRGPLPLTQVALTLLARHRQPPSVHGLSTRCLQEQVAMRAPAMRSAHCAHPRRSGASAGPVLAEAAAYPACGEGFWSSMRMTVFPSGSGSVNIGGA